MEGNRRNIYRKLLSPKVHVDVYAHDFGLIVPCESGFIWELQTQGVMCSHPKIEGVYIPLERPRDNILGELRDLNYKGTSTVKQWKRLKKCLLENERLQFEEVDPPSKDFPENQEALQWIKIISWNSYIKRGKELEGETVVLVYPNCD